MLRHRQLFHNHVTLCNTQPQVIFLHASYHCTRQVMFRDDFVCQQRARLRGKGLTDGLQIFGYGQWPAYYCSSAPRVGGIKRRCASDVCLSVTYIGPKSRTERSRKTKIGTEVAHVTRDSDTTFKVKRSKVNLQGRGILWRLPAQLVQLHCGGNWIRDNGRGERWPFESMHLTRLLVWIFDFDPEVSF